MENILANTKECAAAHKLKLPNTSRTIMPRSHFREHHSNRGCCSRKIGRQEFFEALDQARSEIEYRFDQSGMITAAHREQILVDFVRGTAVAEANLGSLPNNIDGPSLCLQLRMLRDLTIPGKFQIVHEIEEFIVKPASTNKGNPSCVCVYRCLLHPQRDLSQGCVRSKLGSLSLSLRGD